MDAIRRYADVAHAMRADAVKLLGAIDEGARNYAKVRSEVLRTGGWGRKPVLDDWNFFQLEDKGRTEARMKAARTWATHARDEADYKLGVARDILAEP